MHAFWIALIHTWLNRSPPPPQKRTLSVAVWSCYFIIFVLIIEVFSLCGGVPVGRLLMAHRGVSEHFFLEYDDEVFNQQQQFPGCIHLKCTRFSKLVHLSLSAPRRLWPCKLQAVRSEVRGRVRLKYSCSNSRQYESNSRGYLWAVYSPAAHW